MATRTLRGDRAGRQGVPADPPDRTARGAVLDLRGTPPGTGRRLSVGPVRARARAASARRTGPGAERRRGDHLRRAAPARSCTQAETERENVADPGRADVRCRTHRQVSRDQTALEALTGLVGQLEAVLEEVSGLGDVVQAIEDATADLAADCRDIAVEGRVRRLRDDLEARGDRLAQPRGPAGAGGRHTPVELMTDTKPAAADPVSDGLIVRGRPPFAMTPTSLLRNPSVSSHAVRLWSVLASYTYGDQATDRPSRAQLASRCGLEVTAVGRHLPHRAAGRRLPHRRSGGGDPTVGRPGTCTSSNGNPKTRPPRSVPAVQVHCLWMTLFPQLAPMRRILRMGSPVLVPMRRILRIPMSSILLI